MSEISSQSAGQSKLSTVLAVHHLLQWRRGGFNVQKEKVMPRRSIVTAAELPKPPPWPCLHNYEAAPATQAHVLVKNKCFLRPVSTSGGVTHALPIHCVGQAPSLYGCTARSGRGRKMLSYAGGKVLAARSAEERRQLASEMVPG